METYQLSKVLGGGGEEGGMVEGSAKAHGEGGGHADGHSKIHHQLLLCRLRSFLIGTIPIRPVQCCIVGLIHHLPKHLGSHLQVILNKIMPAAFTLPLADSSSGKSCL